MAWPHDRRTERRAHASPSNDCPGDARSRGRGTRCRGHETEHPQDNRSTATHEPSSPFGDRAATPWMRADYVRAAIDVRAQWSSPVVSRSALAALDPCPPFGET